MCVVQVCRETWNFAQTIALSKPMALKLLLVSNLQTGRWDDPRKNDEVRAARRPSSGTFVGCELQAERLAACVA